MSERPLFAAAASAAVASLVAWPWGARAAIGVLAGAAWNLANLGCLARLLAAWLVPPPARGGDRRPESHPRPLARFQSAFGGRWQVVGWLLVKFPLLYLLIVFLFRSPAVSVAAFAVGFSVVLVTAAISIALQSRRLAHGR